MARYRVEMTLEVEGDDLQIREGVVAALSNRRVQPTEGTDMTDLISMAMSTPEAALFLSIGMLELDKQLSVAMAPLAFSMVNNGLRVTPA